MVTQKEKIKQLEKENKQLIKSVEDNISTQGILRAELSAAKTAYKIMRDSSTTLGGEIIKYRHAYEMLLEKTRKRDLARILDESHRNRDELKYYKDKQKKNDKK